MFLGKLMHCRCALDAAILNSSPTWVLSSPVMGLGSVYCIRNNIYARILLLQFKTGFRNRLKKEKVLHLITFFCVP